MTIQFLLSKVWRLFSFSVIFVFMKIRSCTYSFTSLVVFCHPPPTSDHMKMFIPANMHNHHQTKIFLENLDLKILIWSQKDMESGLNTKLIWTSWILIPVLWFRWPKTAWTSIKVSYCAQIWSTNFLTGAFNEYLRGLQEVWRNQRLSFKSHFQTTEQF